MWDLLLVAADRGCGKPYPGPGDRWILSETEPYIWNPDGAVWCWDWGTRIYGLIGEGDSAIPFACLGIVYIFERNYLTLSFIII